MRRFLCALWVIGLCAGGSVGANPPLRDVPEIDNGLFVVGLAHEIHKKCPSIKARFLRGIGALQDLKRDARELGYSEAEIRAHVESKAEKKRLRSRAADYMADQGLKQTEDGYCALGRAEIARKSEIGVLLRTTE